MKKSTKSEMFVEARVFIAKYHSGNPIDYVTSVTIFYYLSGRFPDASIHDCCSVVEALRKHYMLDMLGSVDDDLSCDDDELPFE